MTAQSTHMQLMQACQTTVQGLDLPNGLSQQVYIVPVISARPGYLPTLPAVAISTFGSEGFQPTSGDNKSDEVVYPVAVAVVDNGNQSASYPQDPVLYARELIFDKFVHNALNLSNLGTQINGIYPGNLQDTSLSFQSIIDPMAWWNQGLISALVVNFRVRRMRRGGV